jgi:hypothetical protein
MRGGEPIGERKAALSLRRKFELSVGIADGPSYSRLRYSRHPAIYAHMLLAQSPKEPDRSLTCDQGLRKVT